MGTRVAGRLTALLVGLAASACGTDGTPPVDADAGPADAPSELPVDAPIDDPIDRPVDSALDNALDVLSPVDRSDGAADGADGATETDSAPAALRCNGHEALCDRRFNEVVYPGAHNAMSNSDDGWIAANQVHAIPRQLADGIRAMLLDTYSWMGTSFLCHSSCLLGSKRLSDGLDQIATFLRQNPNEVLTLVFEDYLSAAETEAAFVESGLDKMVYTHVPGSAWPTLRTMIRTNQRVFVGAQTAGPPPAWYHHFYDLAWDTPYAFKTPADFSCAQNRGKVQNDLFLLNHWLENPLPSEISSATANARDVLLARARKCQQESGKLPNFVTVSHYSIGDLFDVVKTLNGL